MKLIVSPTSNRQRFDVIVESTINGVHSKKYLANELPLIHVTQLLPTLILIYGCFGYKVTKEDPYPMGGRVVVLERQGTL